MSTYELLSKHVAMHHIDLVQSQIITCSTRILPVSYCHSPQAVFAQRHCNKIPHHCWLESVSTARAAVKRNRRYSTRTMTRYSVLDASRLREVRMFLMYASRLPNVQTKQSRRQRPSRSFRWALRLHW